MNAEKCDKYLLLEICKGSSAELFGFRAGEIYEPTQAAESHVTLRRIFMGGWKTFSVHVSKVAKLEDIEADLLLAVDSFDERLSIYQERRDHLEMGKRLEVGSKVLVQVGIRKDRKIDQPGEIKCKRLLPKHKGIWFRVELESCATRAGQGSFGNDKYFNCKNGTVIHVSLDRIKLRADQEPKTVPPEIRPAPGP